MYRRYEQKIILAGNFFSFYEYAYVKKVLEGKKIFCLRKKKEIRVKKIFCKSSCVAV